MVSRRHVLRCCSAGLGVAALMLTTAKVAFAELAKPAGDVVLSLDGDITVTNSGAQADFDMAMLRAMPVTTVKTTTPWTDGETSFEGVLLKDLFSAVGASGKSAKASALNDYIANLDVETLLTSGAIIAYRINGTDISVRDKGPLWIMFPFDEKPQLRAETIYSQSVWQLRKITFVK